LLKAFLYLTDVDAEAGPFEYVPRSAPGSELDHLWPWRPLGENYPPEEELDAKVEGRAVKFTAPRGTLIFCNTSGFHRGGFAVGKPRVLATVTYSSPASLASLTERNFSVRPDSVNGLGAEQRYALSCRTAPRRPSPGRPACTFRASSWRQRLALGGGDGA